MAVSLCGRAASQSGGGSDTQSDGTNLRIWPEAAQVALQVTVGHQLHHYQGGLTFGHHAQEADLHRHTQGG